MIRHEFPTGQFAAEGWSISGIEITETGLYRNSITLDVECTDMARENLLPPIHAGLVIVPNEGFGDASMQLGSGRVDYFSNADDQDIEVSFERVPLFWGKVHKLQLHLWKGRHNFPYAGIPFLLDEAWKDSTVPVVQGLDLASAVRPAEYWYDETITAKVKVVWKYDFGDTDHQWFRYGVGDIAFRWHSAYCRANDDGRCTTWVPLRPGDNTISVTPEGKVEGTTGLTKSIAVHNPIVATAKE